MKCKNLVFKKFDVIFMIDAKSAFSLDKLCHALDVLHVSACCERLVIVQA